MAVMLTDLERKLLRLVLCATAQPGEIATGAYKLIESLRERGVESAAVEAALEGHDTTEEEEPPPPVMSCPDYGLTVMPFGQYKGQMFMDIPPRYLRWLHQWITEDPYDRAGLNSKT